MNEFELGQHIAEIIFAEKERPLTVDETRILNNWLNQDSGNVHLYESLNDGEKIPAHLKELESFNTKKAFDKFTNKVHTDKKIKIAYKNLLKIAAIFLLLISTIYFVSQWSLKDTVEIAEHNTSIQPGSSKAILQLADGTVINLENEVADITETDGTLISTNQKEVVYSAAGTKVKPKKVKYNTIEIPRGGEYQLTLSDGTSIWLNSEAVIKYPVVFSENIREVFIEGEAFFEVARDENTPFVVNTSKMRVDVLGTSFNVRAYSNEDKISTTLVHGKVMITQCNNKQKFYLKPCEQFVLAGQESTVRKVNVEQFIAWKEGRILFEDNPLHEILTDLGRWYNVSFSYENDESKNLRYSIDMKRFDKFSDILEIINLTQKVKFEINENEVTVLKF